MPVTGTEPTIAAYLRRGDGTLYKIAGGSGGVKTLDELEDVTSLAAVNNDTLVYDQPSGQWVPVKAVTVSTVAPTAAPARDGLTWYVVP